MGAILAITGLAVGIAIGATVAVIPSAEGVFTACVDKGGNVKLIDPAVSSCPNNHKAVTWNQVGPPGPVGPTGDAGTPGDTEMLTATRLLTSAEIRSLNSSPVELLPGIPGKVYWPMLLFWHYRFGTTAYTGADNVNVGIAEVGPFDSGILTRHEDLIGLSDIGGSATYFASSAMIGAPLVIKGNGDFADGDGTFEVTVLYRVMPASP